MSNNLRPSSGGTLTGLVPQFLHYASAELGFRPQTLPKYEECLRHVARILDHYFHFYNYQRPHQALGYRTSADLYPRRRRT